MHGVREALLIAKPWSSGSLVARWAPLPCPNEVYEREMMQLMTAAKLEGVSHVIFGDLFLEDIRAYREAKLSMVGMTPLFPLVGAGYARARP